MKGGGRDDRGLALATVCVVAFLVLAVVGVATGVIPATCNPPRHIISFVAADGFRTEECVLPTPSPPAPAAANPRR